MYNISTTGTWHDVNDKLWWQTGDFRQHRDENYDNKRGQIIKTISEMDSRQWRPSRVKTMKHMRTTCATKSQMTVHRNRWQYKVKRTSQFQKPSRHSFSESIWEGCLFACRQQEKRLKSLSSLLYTGLFDGSEEGGKVNHAGSLAITIEKYDFFVDQVTWKLQPGEKSVSDIWKSSVGVIFKAGKHRQKYNGCRIDLSCSHFLMSWPGRMTEQEKA